MEDPTAHLAAQISSLQAENAALRQELGRLQQHVQQRAEQRQALLSGGARLLVPLLDRQRVARSFGELALTISRFADAAERWPSKDEVLTGTRTFLESCVRFVIRQRAIVVVFSMLATAIPVIQVWLVMQQNEIIENQARFSEMQVYDVVSGSLVSGNRNARLMTSALLARSDPQFLAGVIDEAFAADLGVIAGREGVDDGARRLEDAAFRGHLIRAVVSGATYRARTEEDDAIEADTTPMLEKIVLDAADRVPVVMRLGEDAGGIDAERREQVSHYLLQLGAALRVQARLARSVGRDEAFVAAVRPFLVRASTLSPRGSVFEDAYSFALQDFVAEAGSDGELEDPPVEPSDEALQAGLAWLRAHVDDSAVDWSNLETQLGGAR